MFPSCTSFLHTAYADYVRNVCGQRQGYNNHTNCIYRLFVATISSRAMSSIFDNFGVFIHFGQIVGILPYRVKFDPSDGNSRRFVFSWWHPLTAWFIFSFLLQFSPIGISVLLSSKIFQQLFNNPITNLTPITSFIIAAMGYGFHNALFLVSRRVTLHYHQWHKVIDSINSQVIHQLEESSKDLLPYRNLIKKRISIGIFIIVSRVVEIICKIWSFW